MVKETEPAEDKIKETKPTDATSEDKEITEPETTETKSEASEAKNEDTEITLPAGDGAVWTISDDSVSEEMLAGMDLTVSLDKEDVNIPGKVIDKLKTDDYMLMSIAYDGEFGFDAVLTIDTGKEHTGKYANLYYFNEDREKLELVDSVLVGTDGNAAFDLSHASDYVITFSDKQMITQSGSNAMLFIILGLILAGGIGVLVFVLVMTGKATASDDDFYYDSDDDR